ncbi:transposase [Aeromicrobium sp. PE09-221]|uniref:transposase n=1 Tax=Aeromicrobium sp. PE09-221 TaxID=1898043 RepID=UPI001EFFCF55|nr:transposase [Aeromicrobium sp. PE09-221]
MVRRLGRLRGISTLTAFSLAVEIGDWHRFTGRSIGSCVGLVPSEYSSGASRAQGPIIKAGNSHARRLLVEAAWHHRSTISASRALSSTVLVRLDSSPPGPTRLTPCSRAWASRRSASSFSLISSVTTPSIVSTSVVGSSVMKLVVSLTAIPFGQAGLTHRLSDGPAG